MKHLKFPKNKSKIKNRILKGALIFFFIFVLFNIINYSIVFGAGKGIWKGTQCAEFSSEGGPTIPCDFCDAIIVAKNIMDYIIKYVIVIGGIMIVVGGIFLMISMGPSGSKDLYGKGIKSIRRAVIGVVIALFSYLIVSEFLHILTGDINKLPWTSISCKHNEAYKDVGKLFENLNTTLPDETKEDIYAKIANDGYFACSSSTAFLRNTYYPQGPEVVIHDVKVWKYYLGFKQSEHNKVTICGKKAREVADKGGKVGGVELYYIINDSGGEVRKYLSDVVYAKQISLDKYVCSLDNCSFSGRSDLINKNCELLAGTYNELESKCGDTFSNIKDGLRVKKPWVNF